MTHEYIDLLAQKDARIKELEQMADREHQKYIDAEKDVRRLEKENAELHAALEWPCPACSSYKEEGHTSYCVVTALRAELTAAEEALKDITKTVVDRNGVEIRGAYALDLKVLIATQYFEAKSGKRK